MNLTKRKVGVLLSFLFFSITIILFQACKTPSIIATQAIQQGDEMNNQQNYEQAIIHYQKYLEVAPSLGLYRNIGMEADVYRKLSHAYSTKSKYKLSLSYLHSALKIDSTLPPNSLQVIEDYRKIGIIYGLIGDFNKGILFLNKSLKLNKGMDRSIKDVKKLSIADTYMSIAQINYTIGNYYKTNEYLEKSLLIYKKVPNEYIGLIEAYLLSGKLKIETEKANDGINLIKQSMKVAKENNLNTARHDQVLSRAMVLKAEYEEALKYALSALEKAEKSKIISQIIWMNVKVGDVYDKIGDLEKAEKYYREALDIKNQQGEETSSVLPSIKMRLGDVQEAYDIFTRSGSNMGAALACLKLGFLKSENHQTTESKNYFRQADKYFTLIGTKEGQAVSKLGLVKVLIDTDSLIVVPGLLQEIGQLSSHPENEWKRMFELGRVYEKQAKIDSAYFAYQTAIKIIEEIRGKLSLEEFRSSYIENKMHVYERLIMLLLGSNDKKDFPGIENSPIEEAFYYSERAKARAFLDIIGNTKIEPKNISDTLLLQEEYYLRYQIQKLSKEIQKTDIGYYDKMYIEDELESLRESYKNNLQLIKLKNNNYKSLVSVKPPKLSEIRAGISKNSAILEYWSGKNQLVIWFISKEKIKAKIVKIGEKETEELVSDCRDAILSNKATIRNKLLSQFYIDLIKPVENELRTYKSIYIVPHRSLHFLPFHALINTKKKYLTEKFYISYAPSAAVLTHCNSIHKSTGNNFLGMALGDLSLGNYSGLPGTEQEIKQIMLLYKNPTTKFLTETNESFVKNNGKKFDILHIATHGVMNNILPMYSYLLLNPDKENDGQLSVNEIYGLDLKCKLVTLSACETGLGELSQGDELISMSRAFIYAGTPAIIVSLWPVDDTSTALLMTKFYQYYSAGYPIREALSFAQRSLINNTLNKSTVRGLTTITWNKDLKDEIDTRSENEMKNPFFWAPFIIIGNSGN